MRDLIRSKSASFGGVAIMAAAIGAFAVGAFAIGALAVGRLAIRRLSLERAKVGTLEIEDLIVTRLHAAEATVSDSIKLPESMVEPVISLSGSQVQS